MRKVLIEYARPCEKLHTMQSERTDWENSSFSPFHACAIPLIYSIEPTGRYVGLYSRTNNPRAIQRQRTYCHHPRDTKMLRTRAHFNVKLVRPRLLL